MEDRKLCGILWYIHLYSMTFTAVLLFCILLCQIKRNRFCILVLTKDTDNKEYSRVNIDKKGKC